MASGRTSFALWLRHRRCQRTEERCCGRGNPEPSVRFLFRLAWQFAHDVQGHSSSSFKSQQAYIDAQARKQGFLQGCVHRVSRHCRAEDNAVSFFTGTRQAYLPGGLRTGAPGKHVVSGKAKYRLVDEQVRYFVAPSIEDLNNTPVNLHVNQADLFFFLTNFRVVPSVKTIRVFKSEVNKGPEERDLWKAATGRADTRALSQGCS